MGTPSDSFVLGWVLGLVLKVVLLWSQVYTSDLKGAGTDANVAINLVGEAGETGDKALVANYDTFERAQVMYYMGEWEGVVRKFRTDYGVLFAHLRYFLIILT